MNKFRDSLGRFEQTPGTADWRTIDFWNVYVPYYKEHSRKDTCQYFNITEQNHKAMCKANNFKKDWAYIRQSQHKNAQGLPETFDEILNRIDFNNYREYYENHTREETCKYFNISRVSHEKLCLYYEYNPGGRSKATKSINRRNLEKKETKINNLLTLVKDFNDYITYYMDHSREETLLHYNITRIEHDFILDLMSFRKDRQSIRNLAAKKYFFDNKWFDSMPEVAVYRYYTDHNISIEFEPIQLKYIYNNKEYIYIPDFKIQDKLIEIKGNQFFKADGTMCNPYDHTQDEKYELKHQCGLQNNVQFWKYQDYKFAIDYCINTYGIDWANLLKRTK